MRITNNMLINNMTYNLNNGLKRMEKLQYQTSTGKKFRLPSDDPIGASKSLKFNTDISKIEQYRRNAEDADSWMKESETALMEINTVLKRTNDLMIQAANDTNATERDKIKAEISELKDHVIQIGNTTYAGRSIFTGFKTDQDLLESDPKSDNYGKYKVDVKNEEKFIYNVGVAETTTVNILGNQVFGKVDVDANGKIVPDAEADYTDNVAKDDTPYLIAMFTEIEDALDSSKQEDIQTSLGNIKGAMDNILSVTAEVGARVNRLELTSEKLKDQALNLEELLSFNEDVDIAKAYLRLSMEQNVYTAGLSVGAKIIQPSLADFIR